MLTIKFHSWDDSNPLHRGTPREKQAICTSLKEARDTWHRLYQVSSIDEFEEWKQKHGWGAAETSSMLPGYDPHGVLDEMKKNDDHTPVYFEYLTFYDEKDDFCKCIVYCCNVFIMNDSGQTIDSFSA